MRLCKCVHSSIHCNKKYSNLAHHMDVFLFFFFNDTATTEIYTLSLHDALPISTARPHRCWSSPTGWCRTSAARRRCYGRCCRSEEHTSELQSLTNLVCRLLLEKKKRMP